MTRDAWIVFDLGFGDAGKGATVDFLVRVRAAGLVVRFNGGAQAGHNVVTPEGVHHTFSQIGSGTFVEGTRTLLGPRFILHPGALLVEERRLRDKGVADVFDRLCVDRRALIVSPFQQAAGRLREMLRGEDIHGTCGVGIGEAVRDALEGKDDTIRVADLSTAGGMLRAQQRRIRQQLDAARRVSDPRAAAEWALLDDPQAAERTQALWETLSPQLRIIEPEETREAINGTDTVIFEGAQGILLDQDHGFHPHTTWSDCTPRGALELLDGSGAEVRRLGVVRTYMVRHGPGPFPTHDIGVGRALRGDHNDDHGWQGPMRRGALDCVLLRYSLEVCGGVDGLALNCIDQARDTVAMSTAYRWNDETIRRIPAPSDVDLQAVEHLGKRIDAAEPVIQLVQPENLIARIEDELEAAVWLVAEGQSASERRWLCPVGNCC